jgi:ATP-dependent protease ClpP protease subunit
MSHTTKDKLTQLLSDLHNHNCNISTREIYLHSHYGSGDNEETGIDFRSTTTFIKNIQLLENNNKNILIHLHSFGGCAHDTLTIYDIIKLKKSPITILGYSMLASGGTIIFQAADLRVLMQNTAFMVHNITVSDDNLYNAYMSYAKYTEKTKKTIINIYAKRCINGEFFKKQKNMTIEKCTTYLNNKITKKGDWWLDADEAIFYGFADKICDNIDNIRIDFKHG